MRQTIKVLLIFGFVFLNSQVFAQIQDFRTWLGVEISTEVFNKVDVKINPELRLWDNSSRFEGLVTEVEATVPLHKNFRVGGFYRYQYEFINEDFNHTFHRFGVQGEVSYSFNRLKIGYRAIYQQEYSDWYNSTNGSIPLVQFRNKIGLNYNIKGSKISPYFSCEWFSTLKPEWKSYQEKLRISAGISRKINKNMALNIGYKYQQEYFEANPVTSHILSIGYSLNL